MTTETRGKGRPKGSLSGPRPVIFIGSVNTDLQNGLLVRIEFTAPQELLQKDVEAAKDWLKELTPEQARERLEKDFPNSTINGIMGPFYDYRGSVVASKKQTISVSNIDSVELCADAPINGKWDGWNVVVSKIVGKADSLFIIPLSDASGKKRQSISARVVPSNEVEINP